MKPERALKIGAKYIRHYTSGWLGCNAETMEVKLMAVSGKHAMVRRPGAMPFVCAVKDLQPLTKQGNESV